MDYLPSLTVQLAHIFFPTRTLFETETSFVNQEGRVQSVAPVYRGGIPISQISAGSHPPRLFQSGIPGGEPEPSWQIMAELASAMLSPGREIFPISRSELWRWITNEYPAFSNVRLTDGQSDGIRVDLGRGKEEPFASDGRTRPEKAYRGDKELELLIASWTFGTEELSAYSKFIQQVEKEPCLFINPKDASRIGVKDKERITLSLDGGRLELELRIVDNMATGVIIVPRHRQLAWQKIEKWPVKVTVDQIKK